MPRRPLRLAIAIAFVVVHSAGAQFQQYIAPGSLAELPADRKLALEQAVKDARWKLGPLRVEPWVSLRELGYVKDASPGGGTLPGDWTATAGAGLRGYVPVGARSTLVLSALPEYVWWRHRTNERRLDGRYGAGLFSYLNRLKVELTATSDRTLNIITPELEQRVNERADSIALDVDVPLGQRFSLFGHGESSRVHADPKGAAAPELFFTPLDRTEKWADAGLRWHLSRYLSIGAGAGSSQVDFAQDARDRSNHGRSLVGEIRFDRPKFGVFVQGSRSRLEGDPGSEIGRTTETSGTAQVRWAPRDRFAISIYGDRQVVYSALATEPYFLDSRIGASVSLHLGWRSSLQLFGETGSQRYRNGGGASSGRVDDVQSIGARFDASLRQSVRMTAGWRRTRVTGGAGAPDRKYDELRAGLVFGGSAERWY